MAKNNLIRVKFLYSGQSSQNIPRWLRQFPDCNPVWGNCLFIFDKQEPNYDWLVVYNDLPTMTANDPTSAREESKCNPKHSLLITSEPSSVSVYGTDYIRQFGYVLTGQEDFALRHPGKIHSQPALQWFYGDKVLYGNDKSLDYNYMKANLPAKKDKEISTVCSSKRQRHTLHFRRFSFVKKLNMDIPNFDWFNRDVRAIKDKAEALDAYRYHVAIENHICEHWWTEKLSDAFLGLTLPFYAGAPNAGDYFPVDSFIPIDIYNYKDSLEIIRRAIRDREYEKRLPAIRESRRRVLDEYNIFMVISKIIEARHSDGLVRNVKHTFLSKKLVRKNPIKAIRNGWEKVAMRGKVLVNKWSIYEE